MRVAVVGIGKLGACLAAVLADAGHTVVGVDYNHASVVAVNAGRPPVEETGLADLMAQLPAGSLRATADYADAIPQADISMVVVPTPSGADGMFVNDHVVAAVRAIGASLTDNYALDGTAIQRRRHTVVVCSTVMPGATGGPIRAALEEAAGRMVGPELGLCYMPFFIALGSVVRDMQQPDIVLLGESDAAAGDAVQQLVGSFVAIGTPVHRMSLESAELVKIATNTYLTIKISFANVLGELCDKLGADPEKVAAAVGADSRIGTKFLRPATAAGGPCLPRDLVAFAAMAKSQRAPAHLAEAALAINDREIARLAYTAIEMAGGGPIAILGTAYKPGTAVTDCSVGLRVAETLLKARTDVIVHDPVATACPPGARMAATAAEAVLSATTIVVATAWPEYRTLDLTGKRVLDPWRITKR